MIQLEDRLYTSTEVAEILGVSLRSVYRYIEENKLDAEVKTATGRHRFSRQNITDFLYPNDSHKDNVSQSVTQKKEEPKKPLVKAVPVVEEKMEAPVIQKVANEPQDTPEEEPVDWLAKFREAAKKFEEERTKDDVVAEPATQAYEEERKTMTHITEKPVQPMTGKFYYRSRLGGLKDIAQNIDKSSRTSDIDYAFTLNAGLSLFKPIKPFSMLHVYIKSKDREFYERTLMLTPSDQNNAQLCLIVSDDKVIFGNKEELHGLFVVAKTRLLRDIDESADSSLIQEAESIIK